MINRRQFLKTTSTLTPSLFTLSPLVNAASGSPSLANLHNITTDHVNTLTGGDSVNLTLLYPEGSFSNLKPIIDQFSLSTSVVITPLGVGVDDINSKIIFNASQGKHLFDIALPASFSLHELVSAHALAPLSSYQKKYEPADYSRDQLYNYSGYIDETFYGYQTDGDAYLMFYNKAMLDNRDNQQQFADAYGYPLAIPKTWQQLDQMIAFFHRPEKKQYGGCLFRTAGYGAWEWWSRFHAKGFYPLDDQLTPQINNEAGIEALEEMLAVSKFLHPNVAGDGLFENWATFSEGQSFCNIGWGGSQKAFNHSTSNVKDNLYYSPAPGGTINSKTFDCPIFNWGWNYVVASSCKNIELAYLFTLFACSPVMSTLSIQQNGFFDPYREEHYEDATIQAIYTHEFLSAHRKSMNTSVPDFYIFNQSAYLSVLQENIALAYNGSITAKQALDLTASEWRRINSRTGFKKQQRAWALLKSKYPNALQEILR